MKKVVCEERCDEGLRFFKDGCCGTIRTIDGGGDKRVIEVNRLGNIYGEDKGTGYAGNVWDKDSLCPTLTTMQGGNREPMIVASRGRNPQNPSDRTPGNHVEQRLEPNSEGICNTLTSVQKDNLVLEPQLKIVDIPQTVSVRKHKVDIENLKKTLREHKKLTNKEIAQELDKPITMIEHWFRKDSSFSIPDAGIWYQLKELLGITTDEFDLQVTEFIEQDGVYEKANRCYMTDGIAPTITSASADEKIVEPMIVASRGRNPQNPSDRTPGNHVEQKLEPNSERLCNTLTSVQKDNLVLEAKKVFGRMGRQAVETFNKEHPEEGDVINPYNHSVDKTGICPTITTRPEGLKTAILPVVKIKQATQQGYAECKLGGVVDLSYPTSKTRRGRVQDGGGDKRVIEVKVIGQMDNKIDNTFESANRVYDTEGLSPTVNTCGGGGLQPKVIVASDRTPGNHVEQRLEPNSEGLCNTLTSVQKDNLVLEPKLVGGLGEKDWGSQWRQGNRVYDSNAVAMALHAQPVGNTGGNSYLYLVDETVKIKQATQQGYAECKLGGVADLSFPTSKTRRGRVQDNGDICHTLTAAETGICRIETPYRIRKLTPLECWRLMDFTDEDFYKAKFVIEIAESKDFIEQTEEKVNKILNSSLAESKKLHHIKNLSVKIRERTSNTQLYKQAGNSIVKAVLMAIFKQMM